MKKVRLLIASVCCIFLTAGWALAAGKAVQIVVDGRELAVFPPPLISENRVLVPLRAVAEALEADVAWNAATKTVVVKTLVQKGERYLQGLPDSVAEQPGIARNFIDAAALRDVLDDDRDGDLADYREGHGGGDLISNDPLVVDVRVQSDYYAAHIPGAVWIAPSQEMGKKENVARLRALLDAHAARGGKNEAVVYCSTGHTAGLVTGVLGTQGLNIKNLKYGFDIAWTGTQAAPAAIKAPTEATTPPSGCG